MGGKRKSKSKAAQNKISMATGIFSFACVVKKAADPLSLSASRQGLVLQLWVVCGLSAGVSRLLCWLLDEKGFNTSKLEFMSHTAGSIGQNQLINTIKTIACL
ncbi:MAG: hypothetical protein WC782_13960 [Methylococcaceae bacterium]